MDPDPGFSGPNAASFPYLPMKKFLAFLLAIAAMSTAPVHAQAPAAAPAATVSPAAAAAVRELLESMKYRDMMTAAFKSMQKQIPVMILQTATNAINANPNLSDAQKKAALDKAAQDVPQAVEAVSTIMNDPKLIDDMIAEIVPLYARHFTVQEIRQLAAFYKTPVGAKLLTTMPQVMTESMEISNRIMAPRINKYIEKVASGK
jgi:hypothetical protein